MYIGFGTIIATASLVLFCVLHIITDCIDYDLGFEMAPIDVPKEEWDKQYEMKNKKYSILRHTMWFFLVMFITLFISIIICMRVADCTKDKEKIDSVNIISMQNVQGVNAVYYCCGGHISTDCYYYMYCDSPDGQILLHKPIDQCYINETNEVTPHIETYEKICKNTFLRWFLGRSLASVDTYYKIYAPKNTINRTFSTDLSQKVS